MELIVSKQAKCDLETFAAALGTSLDAALERALHDAVSRQKPAKAGKPSAAAAATPRKPKGVKVTLATRRGRPPKRPA